MTYKSSLNLWPQSRRVRRRRAPPASPPPPPSSSSSPGPAAAAAVRCTGPPSLFFTARMYDHVVFTTKISLRGDGRRACFQRLCMHTRVNWHGCSGRLQPVCCFLAGRQAGGRVGGQAGGGSSSSSTHSPERVGGPSPKHERKLERLPPLGVFCAFQDAGQQHATGRAGHRPQHQPSFDGVEGAAQGAARSPKGRHQRVVRGGGGRRAGGGGQISGDIVAPWTACQRHKY